MLFYQSHMPKYQHRRELKHSIVATFWNDIRLQRLLLFSLHLPQYRIHVPQLFWDLSGNLICSHWVLIGLKIRDTCTWMVKECLFYIYFKIIFMKLDQNLFLLINIICNSQWSTEKIHVHSNFFQGRSRHSRTLIAILQRKKNQIVID